MNGYVKIPATIHCKLCKDCGARPVLAAIDEIGYIVRCPNDNNHYQTMPGLIDIDDWNRHNTITAISIDYNYSPMLAW